MQATRTTRDHVVRTHWWDTTVSWDYPPTPAAYYDALLSRGASHSRFLRIAYLSTRHPTPNSFSPSSPLDTSTTFLDSSHATPALHLPPPPPHSLSRSCTTVRPRSAHPMAHTLKRRKPQWPKPPHYHAVLLRSPLSHRKGLFRAVLPPSKALDFFRSDISSSSGSCQERDWTSSDNPYVSLHVAESVLAPYEAAAGFFGWHGLGLQVDERRRGFERDRVRKRKSSELQCEMDEAVVDEGRARWARTAEELVGPPGLVLRSIVQGVSSRKAEPSPPLAHRDAYPSLSMSSIPEETRWDSDTGPSPFCPPRVPSVSDEKRPSPPSSATTDPPGSSSGCIPESKSDSPSAWWYGHSPHRGPPLPPHLPPLRFLPPPPVQYGPPPVWFPGGRVASGQGHGYWYGAQPVGASSAKSLPPHSHVFAAPAPLTPIHPTQSPRYPTTPTLGRDEYGPGHECDKETETDHGYESTTTTTDSDPPPHTPIGATTTSHCVEALQLHGDDEVEVHGAEIDEAHAAASVTLRLSHPSTPVKFLARSSTSTSPSSSASSPDVHPEGYESAKAVVVFPSLNGSFCQGSSLQTLVSVSGPGMSAQTIPVSASSLSSSKESTGPGLDEEESKMTHKSGNLEASRPGFRKDSQGFWEPVTPVSPSSSSSSLPFSPTVSRPTSGWIGDKSCDSSESGSSPSTLSAKSRSSSPGPGRVTGAGSTRSSSSRPASFSSSTSTSTSASASLFGGSYPSSPSPPNGSSSIPPNPTSLLPAFLATATVKRKKASRTREIVDRLRSSSIDAGKGGVGLDSLGWLASPGTSASEDVEGRLAKAASATELNHVAGHHAVGGQSTVSGSSPSQSQIGTDSATWAQSELGKEGQATGSKTSAGSSGKNNGATQYGSDIHASPTTGTTTSPSITPFPILNVSQTTASNFTITRQSPSAGTIGRNPVIATPSKSTGAEGLKMNTNVATSPTARTTGPQLVPSTLNGGTSPTVRPGHHPLPSPSHPTVLPQPPIGPPPPPPILAVPAYPHPHPVYMPFTQYHIAPAHQGQQGPGTWVAVYPGRPPHIPVHPLPAQTHVAPITGVSGMRHVSW